MSNERKLKKGETKQMKKGTKGETAAGRQYDGEWQREAKSLNRGNEGEEGLRRPLR